MVVLPRNLVSLDGQNKKSVVTIVTMQHSYTFIVGCMYACSLPFYLEVKDLK